MALFGGSNYNYDSPVIIIQCINKFLVVIAKYEFLLEYPQAWTKCNVAERGGRLLDYIMAEYIQCSIDFTGQHNFGSRSNNSVFLANFWLLNPNPYIRKPQKKLQHTCKNCNKWGLSGVYIFSNYNYMLLSPRG